MLESDPFRRWTRIANTALAVVISLTAAQGLACRSTTSPSTTAPPVLTVPIVDLSALTDFLPFGVLLHDTQLNPAYELYTSSDTVMVHAAAPGILEDILANPAPQTDVELHVRAAKDSIYLFVYDHIVSPEVAIGQSITAGQTLGRIGPFSDAGRNRNGRVELQINKSQGKGKGDISVCPRDFGTMDFNAAHDAALAKFPGEGTNVCLVDTVQP